jgi:hypothetical protein
VKLILKNKNEFFSSGKNFYIQLIFDKVSMTCKLQQSMENIKRIFFQKFNQLFNVFYESFPELNKIYIEKILFSNLQEEIKDSY